MKRSLYDHIADLVRQASATKNKDQRSEMFAKVQFLCGEYCDKLDFDDERSRPEQLVFFTRCNEEDESPRWCDVIVRSSPEGGTDAQVDQRSDDDWDLTIDKIVETLLAEVNHPIPSMEQGPAATTA